MEANEQSIIKKKHISNLTVCDWVQDMMIKANFTGYPDVRKRNQTSCLGFTV